MSKPKLQAPTVSTESISRARRERVEKLHQQIVELSTWLEEVSMTELLDRVGNKDRFATSVRRVAVFMVCLERALEEPVP
jgi:hypothetical protein